MAIDNKRKLKTHSKSDDTFAPIKTLAQSDSAVLSGTLVWGKPVIGHGGLVNNIN